MKVKILLTAITAILISASPVSAKSEKISQGTPVIGIAQPNPPAFVSFRSHRFGRSGATISWSMENANGITGFVLERTYEDPTDPYSVWELAAAVPCGTGRNIRVNDVGLAPGLISYRVVVMNGANAVGMSEVTTVHIVQH